MIEITLDTFESEVKNASGVVLVDFWAGWCGPCRSQLAILSEYSSSRPDVKIAKVNVDDEPALAQMFEVMSIPTLVFYKNGELKKKVVGVHNQSALDNIINSL